MTILNKISIVHHWPWDYYEACQNDADFTKRLIWRLWFYSKGHDSQSWWWCVLGFEINWERD